MSLIFLVNKMRFKSNPLLPDCQGDCEDLKEKEKDSTSETRQHEGLRDPRMGLKKAHAPGKCMLGIIGSLGNYLEKDCLGLHQVLSHQHGAPLP